MTVNRELSEKIPVLSFLATCGIVLYHCDSPANELAANAADLWLNQQLARIFDGPIITLCLCWFFWLTGFLLFRGLSFSVLGKKLARRVRTLLVPYVLWQLLYLVKSILQGNVWTPGTAFAHIFLLRVWPPLQPFWYVYAVFLLSLLSPLLLALLRGEKSGWLAIAALMLLLYAFGSRLNIQNGHLHYILNIERYVPCYLIGAYFGRFYRDEAREKSLPYAIGFLLLGAALDPCIERFLIFMTLSVLPLMLLFYMPLPDWTKNRGLYRASFLIYATHESLISLSRGPIQSALYALGGSAALTNLLGRLLCLALVVAFNHGLRLLMARFTPKTLGLLTGGRG